MVDRETQFPLELAST